MSWNDHNWLLREGGGKKIQTWLLNTWTAPYVISNLYGGVLLKSWSSFHPLDAEKRCNGNPISIFPPYYAFQMIFTESSPRPIQSTSHNFHNKDGALKPLLTVMRKKFILCRITNMPVYLEGIRSLPLLITSHSLYWEDLVVEQCTAW